MYFNESKHQEEDCRDAGQWFFKCHQWKVRKFFRQSIDCFLFGLLFWTQIFNDFFCFSSLFYRFDLCAIKNILLLLFLEFLWFAEVTTYTKGCECEWLICRVSVKWARTESPFHSTNKHATNTRPKTLLVTGVFFSLFVPFFLFNQL